MVPATRYSPDAVACETAVVWHSPSRSPGMKHNAMTARNEFVQFVQDVQRGMIFTQ